MPYVQYTLAHSFHLMIDSHINTIERFFKNTEKYIAQRDYEIALSNKQKLS